MKERTKSVPGRNSHSTWFSKKHPDARFPTHNFPTSNMSKIPALERERLRGWKYEKAPHFYRFFARLGYSPTPFLRYNTTSSAASIIHTFFRYVTQAWAHRIFLRVFIVMDRRYAFSWIFLHSNDKERSIVWKIFAQDFYEFVAQNFLKNKNIAASLWLHLKHWLRRGFILFTTANFFICTIKW